MSNVPLPSSFDGDAFYEETVWQKIKRGVKEEPLVPVGRVGSRCLYTLGSLENADGVGFKGCVLTCAALLGAFRSSYRGDPTTMNRMLRGRIYAQGFTVVALVAGSVYYETDRTKRKEFEGTVKERKAQEKNQAWIRELEARDEEDKMMRERRRRLMERAEAEGRGGDAVDDERMEERVGGVLEAVKNLGK